MKRNKILCIILSLILLPGIFLCISNETEKEQCPVSFLVESPEGTETIRCWQDDANWYCVIPGYAELSDVRIKKETGGCVTIGGRVVDNNENCGRFLADTVYDLTYSLYGTERKDGIVFLNAGEIATMYVDTQSGDMDYLHRDRRNKEEGTFAVYTADGKLDNSGEIESMKCRGNYTWYFSDKKPYSLTLSKEADLLGMELAQEWILVADSVDSTHLRNKIVYDFATEAGLPYSPDIRWTALYLNGVYAGVYQLCERNEVHENRVDLSGQGSYLVSLEAASRFENRDVDYVKTNADLTLRIHYPKNPSQETKNEVQNIWQSVENAILAEDGIDSITGKSYQELIDVDSWARKYLIEEIFGNLDACFLSQYFYYDGSGDGCIYAGPVWDYDLSMGNSQEWQLTNPSALHANRMWVKEGLQTPWFASLCERDEFWIYVTELYREEFLPLLEELLEKKIVDYEQQVSSAVKADMVRWPEFSLDAAEQTDALTDYMYRRVEFLNSYFLEQEQHCIVRIDGGQGGNLAYWAVKTGECLQSLPVMENTKTASFIGWYDARTDEPFDSDMPIYEDMAIYAKWDSQSKMDLSSAVKLMPLAVIAVMGVALVAVEFFRWRKSR